MWGALSAAEWRLAFVHAAIVDGAVSASFSKKRLRAGRESENSVERRELYAHKVRHHA
jgi:hypothetical protein